MSEQRKIESASGESGAGAFGSVRVETEWPEEQSGYVLCAFFDGPPKQCCDLPLCKADAWLVMESDTELTAKQQAEIVRAALSSPACRGE